MLHHRSRLPSSPCFLIRREFFCRNCAHRRWRSSYSGPPSHPAASASSSWLYASSSATWAASVQRLHMPDCRLMRTPSAWHSGHSLSTFRLAWMRDAWTSIARYVCSTPYRSRIASRTAPTPLVPELADRVHLRCRPNAHAKHQLSATMCKLCTFSPLPP